MDVIHYIKETGASTEAASTVFNIPSSSTVRLSKACPVRETV